MKLKFNKIYFLLFLALFAIEIVIAIYFKQGFIRHTFGDFLVVILLYCLFKSFIKASVWAIAIVTLLIAYIIEFLQLTDFLHYLGLGHHKLANIVFGNSFSIQDLVAYTMGILFTIFMEKIRVIGSYLF